MKEKIKVGDIVEYRECFCFSDDIQIIGYVIGASISNTDVPIGYYRIIVLKDNKKRSLRHGKIITVNDYFGSLTKLY